MIRNLWYSNLHYKVIVTLKPYEKYEINEFYSYEIWRNLVIRNYYTELIVHYKRARAHNFFNIYVLVFFVVFIVIHMVSLPLYILLFMLNLIKHTSNIIGYWYYSQPQIQLEYKHYSSEFSWVEILYNVTYRRANLVSFTLLYLILKTGLGKSLQRPDFKNRLAIILKNMIIIFIRFLWVVTLYVPLGIITRSYEYASAFWSTTYNTRNKFEILRSLVINNYMLSETEYALSLRIYRTTLTCWNFNPKYTDNTPLMNLLRHSTSEQQRWFMKTTLVSNCQLVSEGFKSTNHYTTKIPIGYADEHRMYIATNVTSNWKQGPKLYASFQYETDLPTKVPKQSILTPYIGFDYNFEESYKTLDGNDPRVLLDKAGLFKTILASQTLLLASKPNFIGFETLHKEFCIAPGIEFRPHYVKFDPEFIEVSNSLHDIFSSHRHPLRYITPYDIENFMITSLREYAPKTFKYIRSSELGLKYGDFISDLISSTQ